MFDNLRGKFQLVQDGLSARIINGLKIKDEEEICNVNFNAGVELLRHKQEQQCEIQIQSQKIFEKAQFIDVEIQKIEENTLKEWNQMKELSTFISVVPELTKKVEDMSLQLISLQNLTSNIEDCLIKFEDAIEIRELENEKLLENFRFSKYSQAKMSQLEAFKGKLERAYEEKLQKHEKERIDKLKERQDLLEMAFKQDLELYRESGIMPTTKGGESSVSLEDIEIEADLDDLNELLKNE